MSEANDSPPWPARRPRQAPAREVLNRLFLPRLEFRNGVEERFTVALKLARAHAVDLEEIERVLRTAHAHIAQRSVGKHHVRHDISRIDKLLAQGAKALLFDVRFNGGGYKDEMVKLLDKLLPEGTVFQSEDYAGKTQTDTSDSACIELPMAVLVNRDSYSAAEFFAAALQEYDWAKVVGEKTCGKGNFQTGFPLSDGSYLNISIGKYYTPQGRSLTDIGVTPDEEIEYDDETYAKLYYGQLPDEEDTQLQAAIGILTDEIS